MSRQPRKLPRVAMYYRSRLLGSYGVEGNLLQAMVRWGMTSEHAQNLINRLRGTTMVPLRSEHYSRLVLVRVNVEPPRMITELQLEEETA